MIGDSGYPLEPWLMTPIPSPTTPREEAYNTAHIRTRNVVERSFGLLKSRFRCRDKSGGTLLYSPEKVVKITLACVILHNYCTRRNLQATESNNSDGEPDEMSPCSTNVHNSQSAIKMRQDLLEDMF